ncbi:ABC transporter substrate-binding protein [Roseovarius sp. SCSIO 43702]|uniref:ABC transporter substrate-binding protein n=1 Tax=Roseovarius sp. SCSIO 43702 TaxID=2823043 RepID=UPI001C739629|nr:ABC transporter substrate-binding protein [Roseovarius sp. SCSIO 43702]QYX55748.1 ABC transporter substrate-binding protein [Roseovarius sp. SCSIO 43702]
MKHLIISTGLAAAMALPAVAETLQIGTATAQTGSLAYADAPTMKGMKLAVEEINEAGGIGGTTKIELIEKDVRSDAAQTSIAAQELADAGVSVIVLPGDSDPSLAAVGVVSSAGIPAISTVASSPTLPEVGGEFMFSNFPGDNVQATVSAEWAREQGYETAWIVYSPDTQYTTMPLYFADVFEKLGGEVVGRSTNTIGQQDFSAIATTIASQDPQPDVVMTSAYEPDFPSLLKALRAAGVESQIIGSDGIDSPTTFSLGDVGEGVVFTTAGHATPGSALEAFDQAYEAKYGEAPETIYSAVGYDLIKVIEAAVLAAEGSTDPKDIRDAMAELENVQGATGLITYKGTNGMPVRQVSIIRVKDGERELVAQPTPDPDLIPAPRMQ